MKKKEYSLFYRSIFTYVLGLDPSAPYFENQSTERRLDETDADFVDVIHTDTKVILGIKSFGSPQPMGHVDFYPNGGYHQPNCLSLDSGKFFWSVFSRIRTE